MAREFKLSESKLASDIEPTFKTQHIKYERRRQQWMRCSTIAPLLWSPIDPDEVAAIIDQELTALLGGDTPYQASTVKGVMDILRWRRGFTLKRPVHTLLPCLNGVLNLTTQEIRDYNPDDEFTWALPYNYDEHATCPLTIQWLSETVRDDEETVQLLRAYLKAILTSRVDLHRYLELIGPGGGGKGTFTRIAQGLVGFANSDVSNLKTLEGSRFETAGLVDKKLLILTDEERFTGSVTTLKALTGGDSIRIERKHKDKAQAENLCMVLISANEPILSPDYTSGLARRRLTVHFANQVKTRRDLLSLHTGVPTGELAHELPGMLNWVLSMPDDEMVRRLRTTTSLAQVDTKVMILKETNPLAAWADDCLMIADDNTATYIGMARRLAPSRLYDVPMDTFDREDEWLYANYRGWMLRAGFKDGVSLMRFSALLVDLCREQLGLTHVFKPPKDETGYHIVGIRFRTDEDLDTPGLVTEAIRKTLVLQKTEGLLKATAQETEDSEHSEDFLEKNFYTRARVEKNFPQNPSGPSESSGSRAQASSKPSKSFRLGTPPMSNGHNPRYKRDAWPYGRPRR
jgi:putative DNA primase/helicase